MRLTRLRFALLLACAACLHTSRRTDGAKTIYHDPNVISREELEDPAIAGRDARNAIQQLRPAFFNTRGTVSMKKGGSSGLVQISQEYGPLQQLSQLSAIDVRTLVEIRYLDAVQATARFGINANGGPVIVLLTTVQ